MSGLAAPQGIPIPPDEIRSALESVAIPGYTGTLQLEIGLRPDAASCVMIGVIRRQRKSASEQPAAVKQTLPDPERKKPVQRAVEDLKARLYVRTVLTAVEANYLDGVLQNFTIQE